MIMFWAAASILTLVILAMMALPLLRKKNDNKPTAADYDVAVYKSQLAEVEREALRGAFSPSEAEAARAEIARRLLAADTKSKTQSGDPVSKSSMKLIAILMALLVTIATVAMYLELGSPGLPSKPLAEREVERAEMQAAAEATSGMGDVIDKLEAKLAEAPERVDGWMLLGRSYLAVGRVDESLEAYEKAIAIDRTFEGLLSTYGEVMVMDAQGGVLEPAMNIFKEALTLDTNDIRARFYIAQGNYQAGRPMEALEAYVALANSAPPTAPWQPMVREAAISIANELEVNVADKLPVIPETNGPDSQDMAAAGEMSEGERQEMIKGMVAKLAERLKDEPENLEGWMRLGQSYTVLGEFEKSADAFDKASALAPDNPEILLKKGRSLRSLNTNIGYQAARAVMEQVLVMDANNVEALWMSGVDEANKGNAEAASGFFEKTLAVVGKSSSDYINLRMEADNILAKLK